MGPGPRRGLQLKLRPFLRAPDQNKVWRKNVMFFGKAKAKPPACSSLILSPKQTNEILRLGLRGPEVAAVQVFYSGAKWRVWRSGLSGGGGAVLAPLFARTCVWSVRRPARSECVKFS